jgi:hypothetical protein
MKVRILTFWGVPNHGCFLQAYALQMVLQHICKDDDVKQIAYLGKKHYDFYYNSRFDKRKILRLKKEFELRKYIKHYNIIPHTYNKCIIKFPSEKMDILVLGSDIIWDYNSELLYGEEYLFGGGVLAEKKISYAPSFGNSNSIDDIPEYVNELISSLDAISVRDENSQKIVEIITGNKPELVLDPTLLYDFSNDENIILPHEKEPYAIVYGSDFTDLQIQNLTEFAKKRGLKIINLEFMGKCYSWCDKTIRRDQLSPFEWLGYFKYSSCILTSTFHGLMFGMVFQKNMVFNPTEFIMKKVSKLLIDLQVEQLLLNNNDFTIAEKSFNYSVISLTLNQLREKSLEYLEKNIMQ